MKIILDKLFWISTIVAFGMFAFIPIYDEGETYCYHFLKSIRMVQWLSILILSVLFYFLIKKDGSKYNDFYKSDKFYCDLIYTTIVIGIPFTIYFVNWRITNIHGAIKVWEIAAYSVTLLYTIWIWLVRFGKQFVEIIDKKSSNSIEKFKFYGTLILAGLALLAIIVGHILITTLENIFPFIENHATILSISLIFITYYLFDKISFKVVKLTESEIDNSNNNHQVNQLNTAIKEYNEEFTFGLKYMDRPMKWIFGIMLAYALYATGIDFFFDKKSMSELENFFGGAIAFELLLSSLIWAKTKI